MLDAVGAGGDGTRGIADPLAPRSAVNARAFEARVHHREMVGRRRNAGTAVVHDFGWVYAVRFKLGAQRLGRLERAVFVEVALEPAVQRTGNVPGDGIDRLVLAREPVFGAGVDE